VSAGKHRLGRAVLASVALAAVLAHAAWFAYAGFSLATWREAWPESFSLVRYRGDVEPEASAGRLRLRDYPAGFADLVVASEDSRFWEHGGFDPEAIRFARELNAKAGRIVYGGSTITQQLARTLFLTPRKNYLRKYLELLAAVEAELLLPKERILELYLECAEWGPGVYGAARAAAFHYGRPLGFMTRDELVRLVSILPAPLTADPRTVDRHPALAARYNQAVRTAAAMATAEPIFESELERLD